jgi:hypothetical protein
MKYVLFVRTHNAGRSQMARAFFDRDTPPDVRAESAGTQPAREIWPTVVESWDVPDPAGLPLADVRAIRDGIQQQVRRLIDERLDAIYADRTAHQLRLGHVLPPLVSEFAGRHSDDEIRACADAILTRYDDAPVRSFTTILAIRRARECLAAETCEALNVG